MKISVISFTENGEAAAQKVFKDWQEDIVTIECKRKGTGPKSLSEWTRTQFEERNAIVFVGACGIAVRAIAPFVQDKLKDSPVLCMDENGQYVIPILSGHVGGANELAKKMSAKTGAIPVITTATDVQETFAVDLFAKKNNLTIQNKEGIARISSKILNREMVDIVISRDLTELEHGILRLKPKEYIIGIGCRKGKSYEEINAFINRCLSEAGLDISDILAIASIDIKKDEPGIIKWSNCHRIPFHTFLASELSAVEGSFQSSEFVKKMTGVDNVCERSAMKEAGEMGKLVMKKKAENGITVAIAWKCWKFDHKNQEGVIIDET